MAKHDRRKTSGQPPSSRPVTIQLPLPVLGVVNGVREAFHGFCIATGLQVRGAMMEADREVLCGAKGRHQVDAWRGGSVDSHDTRRAAGRARGSACGARMAKSRWRASNGRRPPTRWTSHAGRGRRRGVDAPVRGHAGPGTGRRDRAGDVEQCRVAAVRGAVDKAPPGVSQPALGELDLRAVCIEKVFRDHCMVIALGIDTQGRKHVWACAKAPPRRLPSPPACSATW